jgi:hypothetical protein
MLFGTRFAPIWSCSCAIMQDERYNVGAVRLPGRGGRELLDRMDGSRGHQVAEGTSVDGGLGEQHERTGGGGI